MLANVLLRTQGKSQLLVAATDLNGSLTAELESPSGPSPGTSGFTQRPRFRIQNENSGPGAWVQGTGL